ncbi:sigma-54-dependent transcriptional regulator [Taibaiella koreensis]|uniref:sigma-54-dependent transcriptional regulator n=1 Tax=Taibaiella koreensis TaxID=1268548 RepID=UPI000E59EF6E|nr:sigma-54 dependent transcriptional regulator [Taibaiella koreensis]
MKKILIVDDELSVCTLLTRFLSKNGYDAQSCTSGADALRQLKSESYDIMLCDYHLQDITGKELFEKIQPLYPNIIVIFITGYADVRVAVDLIKNGAYHYLSKPLYPDEILKIIDNALKDGNMPVATHAIPEAKNGYSTPGPLTTASPDGYVIGESEASRNLFEHVNLVAPTDYSVILYGETGTGKEALAHLIHQKSNRRNGPFIAIDCGSLSKELAASELFGHEKGAFTGALHTKEGAFEQAEGGTIFLDEIGNLSYEVQVYLLRALQEKSVRKVGGVKTIKVDIRIIVASNENLYENVLNKTFREDLYHRLNEFTLKVPALREREADLPQFVNTFLANAGKELNKSIAGISPAVWELLLVYKWPGNIRELKNVIRRACLLTPEGKEITQKALPLELLNSKNMSQFAPQQSRSGNEEDQSGNDPSLKNAAIQGEQKRIMEVLQQVKFNKTKAAEILNIDRKTLYNKLRSMQQSNDK